MKISAMGSTKMACPEALMKQEDRYLAALQAAERFESHDGNLLIYYTGSEKPLRFHALKYINAVTSGFAKNKLRGAALLALTVQQVLPARCCSSLRIHEGSGRDARPRQPSRDRLPAACRERHS